MWHNLIYNPIVLTPSTVHRSARESDDEEEDDERRQSRGCTLQYQHATLQVFTQFHTTSSEGTDQVVTMLGPEWMVEVTDLVSDFMRIEDPRVAHLVDSNTLAGREPGTTLFKVKAEPRLNNANSISSASVFPVLEKDGEEAKHTLNMYFLDCCKFL